MFKAEKVARKASSRADVMRKQAMAIAMKRKEEYLGARVPKELKQRVIDQAHAMDIPVSLLLRKVLEEAFAEVHDEKNKAALEISSERNDQRFHHVIAWKALELNQEHQCDRCGKLKKAGSEVMLAVTSNNDEMIMVCPQCKEELQKQ